MASMRSRSDSESSATTMHSFPRARGHSLRGGSSGNSWWSESDVDISKPPVAGRGRPRHDAPWECKPHSIRPQGRVLGPPPFRSSAIDPHLPDLPLLVDALDRY